MNKCRRRKQRARRRRSPFLDLTPPWLTAASDGSFVSLLSLASWQHQPRYSPLGGYFDSHGMWTYRSQMRQRGEGNGLGWTDARVPNVIARDP